MSETKALPLLEKAEQLAIITKMLMRGIEGLDPRENKFAWLLDLESDVERAILTPSQSHSHVYRELLYKICGEPCKVYYDIAKLRNTYSINVHGKGRDYAVLMRRTESQSPDQQVMNVTLPSQAQQQKKGRWPWSKTKETSPMQPVTQ